MTAAVWCIPRGLLAVRRPVRGGGRRYFRKRGDFAVLQVGALREADGRETEAVALFPPDALRTVSVGAGARQDHLPGGGRLMSEEGAYMVFCTELYRREKNLTGKQVADLFSRYNVYDYIRKYFGAFHTMGEKLVFDDIDAYIARQGA